jgi:uncharacterized protein YbbC (DUF1343 family)/CubicO group peptidase (beta-lactamase class C family)
MDMTLPQLLSAGLARAVETSKSPGAVALVGDADRVYFHEAYGLRQLEPGPQPALLDTVYDVASLTKVVATTTAAMLLVQDGALDLDEPVTKHVPIPAFRSLTPRHLLTHTAGLHPGRPYYKTATSLEEMLQRYAEAGLDAPPGTRRRYSDVGFMLLGKVIEMAGRDALDAFCARRIFSPLNMTETGFNPTAAMAARAAATERCAWRGQVVVGTVHDENAWAVGGVSGHAGLFTTALDLHRFCAGLLNGTILSAPTLLMMNRQDLVPFYPWQGLGWQLDPWDESIQGYLPARWAIGHTGWTGTSLWLDIGTGIHAILLGNTCHPSRQVRDNRTFRRTFYSGVAAALYPQVSNVHTGLDRLLYEDFDLLRGKRIALLTHHAAVDCQGRHILEVLKQDKSIALDTIFSPEHGFRGHAEAGESVPSESGPIPIVSLYGNQRVPSREVLRRVKAFVIDMQDVGSRYYTYMATMKDCLEMCGEMRTPVIVLDRPNPIGGAVLEGPIAQQTGSPVCCAAIPVRHGMTMGELAMYFVKHELRGPKPEVMVSTLGGWQRELYFDQCALPWIPPSPNIPSPNTALLYAGTCLVEGTNLNEGRGTEMPFEVMGAPWLNVDAVLEELEPANTLGCALEALTYEPKSIPGKASSPRFMNQTCRGIRIHVTNRSIFRPFHLALALIGGIRRRHPNEFTWEPIFDILAGGPALRQALEQGIPARDIVDSYEPALAAFDARRPKRYL